ncbi:MAG: hypothetical protein CMH12_13880 [Maritimibacter sp.]|nr:hypothetical protein [Maritimibacter sp.]
MIRYALKCTNDHGFESWFAGVEAFDKLAAAGMVACPECGATEVRKVLMAPGVQTARKKPAEPKDESLAAPASEMETKLAALRKHVETTSDYVGMGFASEARKMHEGEIPQRSIYGEAKPEEAKRLIEDGVPVAPLPFRPTRKSN